MAGPGSLLAAVATAMPLLVLLWKMASCCFRAGSHPGGSLHA
jgi:hypothetical protein